MTFDIFTKMATDGVMMHHEDLLNGMTFGYIFLENIQHYALKSCLKILNQIFLTLITQNNFSVESSFNKDGKFRWC